MILGTCSTSTTQLSHLSFQFSSSSIPFKMSNEDFSNNRSHNQQKLHQYQSVSSNEPNCGTVPSSLKINYQVKSVCMTPSSSMNQCHNRVSEALSSSQDERVQQILSVNMKTSACDVTSDVNRVDGKPMDKNQNDAANNSTNTSTGNDSVCKSSISSLPFSQEGGQVVGPSHDKMLFQFGEVAKKKLDCGLDTSKQTICSNQASSSIHTDSCSSDNGGGNGARSTLNTTHGFNQPQCANLNQREELTQNQHMNSAGHMFGNFLHPNVNNDFEVVKKPGPKKPYKPKPKRDRSRLRKGKWTVSLS